MIENENRPSTAKKIFQDIGNAATDTAKLAVKVAFITLVAVSTIGVLKKAASAE